MGAGQVTSEILGESEGQVENSGELAGGLADFDAPAGAIVAANKGAVTTEVAGEIQDTRTAALQIAGAVDVLECAVGVSGVGIIRAHRQFPVAGPGAKRASSGAGVRTRFNARVAKMTPSCVSR